MKGHFLKMSAKIDDPVQYTLNFDEHSINMNEQIGKSFSIHHTGNIHCINCGRKTNKSFFQGYCYPCFTTLPQTDPSIINPEKNQAHLGISRDMEWSKKNDLIDHIVYLALSGGLKVGVTRHTQVPTRWIDQGAHSVIKLARTPHRNLAGQIEVALKKHMNDKTNWRAMLTNRTYNELDLKTAFKKAISLLPNDLIKYAEKDQSVLTIKYPVENYPAKVKSVNLEKNPEFNGTLLGIRGQYLYFEEGNVINIRKYNGYEMLMNIENY